MSKNNKDGLVILIRGVALATLFSGTFGFAIIFSNLWVSGLFLILAIAINHLANELDKM
jgi:hypothetical protein